MKTLSIYSAILASFLAATGAHADFLSATQPIQLKGNLQIVIPATDEDQPAKVKNSAATIENILKTLGITGQNPKKLAYYYDSDTSAIVIADRAIPSTGGTGTPIATVLAYGSGQSWPKSASQTYAGGDCTTLGSLPGTYTELTVQPTIPLDGRAKVKKMKTKDTTTFVAWGVANSANIIFKGVITGLIRPPA